MKNSPRRKIHTSRLEIRLSDASMDRLKRLQDRTEAVSYAEVLRTALTIYENVLDDKPSDPWDILTTKEH